jgi:tyrosyl-tRNA synthetase
MSKSKGNYIGITESPKVMFRKVMQISDELMYRYYELLTDMSLAEIARLRAAIVTGAANPMEAKMDLGRRIVADFHSVQEAEEALTAFDREVRHGLEPADTETVDLPSQAVTDKGIRVDKLIATVNLADSVSDATRKIKAGAVEINGNVHRDLLLNGVGGVLIIRVGKKWKRVNAS